MNTLTKRLWTATFATKRELDKIIVQYLLEEEHQREADKFTDYDDTFIDVCERCGRNKVL